MMALLRQIKNSYITLSLSFFFLGSGKEKVKKVIRSWRIILYKRMYWVFGSRPLMVLVGEFDDDGFGGTIRRFPLLVSQ
jgi:hypothetical protein